MNRRSNDEVRAKLARVLFESTTAKAREQSAHTASWESISGHWRVLYERQADAVIAAFPHIVEVES